MERAPRQRATEKAEKRRGDGRLTKARSGRRRVCRAVLGYAWRGFDDAAQPVTRMTRLMRAGPYHSALCGADTLSSVTMKCKAAVAKRANYKDGQSTYAPQS